MANTPPFAGRRRPGTAVPRFALYGQPQAMLAPQWLQRVHHERIPVRSALHEFDIAAHVHEGLMQLLFITRAAGRVLCDGQLHALRAPAVVLIPAGHVHGFEFERRIDGHVATAAQVAVESVLAVTAPGLLPWLRRPLVLNMSRQAQPLQHLGHLFNALQHEAAQHAGAHGAADNALLAALLVQVARCASTAGMGSPQPQPLARPGRPQAQGQRRPAAQVEQFRARVDERFRLHEPLHTHAAALGITVGQLSRLCRQVLGRSALAVVNQRLLHEAERELAYSTLSIKQLAASLGFEDESYFGRFFRRHAGLTPTQFRQQAHAQLTGSCSSV